MAVGVVSPGQMGAGLGWALRAGGARVVSTLDGRSPRSGRLAEAAGIELMPDLAAVLRSAEIVLVVTPPDAALDAAAAIAAAAMATGARPLIADLNAIAPSTVDSLTASYARAGLSFVDGSISGPPPNVRPGAYVYLSGPRAADVAALPWRHVNPVVLPGPAGRASAVKMCTASVYKGLNGLYAQAMRAAGYYGVLDEVLADLRRAGLDQVTQVAIAAAKAYRFVPEMAEIAAAQHTAGLTPALFEAFAEVYAQLAGTPLGRLAPEVVDRTLTASAVVDGLTPHDGQTA